MAKNVALEISGIGTDTVTFTFLLSLQWVFFSKVRWDSMPSTIDSLAPEQRHPSFPGLAMGRVYEIIIQRPSNGLQTISFLVQNFRAKCHLIGNLDPCHRKGSPRNRRSALTRKLVRNREFSPADLLIQIASFNEIPK